MLLKGSGSSGKKAFGNFLGKLLPPENFYLLNRVERNRNMQKSKRAVV
jgi:hypothetical protein